MNHAAVARCFAQWSDAAHREVVRTYRVGYLLADDKRRLLRRRPAPSRPLLQLVVEARRSTGFADPLSGFLGFDQAPAPDRVLRLWADDLLSVSQGNEWMFVIEAEQPFPPAWLDLLVPPPGTTSEHWHAVVSASFAGPTPAGRFRVADLDATTCTTRVHIEDHRDVPLRQAADHPPPTGSSRSRPSR